MSEELIRYLDSFKDYKERKKILQDMAIKMEMRRMYRKRMILNGAILFIAAVSIFAAIWWCGL